MPENVQQKNLEEKAKEILETDEVSKKESPDQEDKTLSALIDLFEHRSFRIILTIVLMLTLFGITYIIAYLSNKTQAAIPTNFDECVRLESSTIQETYPAVCVTKKGEKFIQEIPEEEELLESDLPKGGVQGAFSVVVIPESISPTSIPQKYSSPTPFEITCLESEKELLEELFECEQVDETMCQQLKSDFEECMVFCQEELGEEICHEVCMPICDDIN
jgi:hypothetical protein